MLSKILNPKPILLFLLALLPRLFKLDQFLTADEFLWADRSRNFLAGLTNPAYQCTTRVEGWPFAEGLACTLRTGHPGVTTMWSGSLGFWLRWLIDGRPGPLHDYVAAISTNPLDPTFIAPERFGTVLIISLGVVAFYGLARRLVGEPVALVAAVLIALDPYYVALSRIIHHDAFNTLFMTLSVLTALIYWGEGRGRRWLLLSGFLAGLAFLSKLASLFLMPFVALVGLWFMVRRGRRLLPTVGEGLLWFGAAMAAVFVCWPAMWVAPLETVRLVFSLGFKYTTGEHAKGHFFLGQIVGDPGPFFYPIAWLYRTTPLILVGLAAGLVAWLRNRREQADWRRYMPLLLLFIGGYYLMMTLGGKKQERYFLPVYPWVNLIAAVGLIELFGLLRAYLAGRGRRIGETLFTTTLPILAIIATHGFFLLYHFPYYFTYYNPLLGGIRGAANTLTIGWGEGLDVAAAYLNHQVNPTQTRVASWYESTFTPYYYGPTISYSKEKGKVLAGEYAIFYINQVQRRFPDDILFEYYDERYIPIYVVNLYGLDYAWIYPSRNVDHYAEDQTYTGIASLLAWQWTNGEAALIPGQPVYFDLFWEYLGKQANEPFFFRLRDAQDRVWAEGLSQPVENENPPRSQWREGEILLDRGRLILPPAMPPGQYRLEIGFYTHAPAVQDDRLLFTIPAKESLVRVGHANYDTYRLPDTVSAIDRPLNQNLTLLGATWPAQIDRSEQAVLPLEIFWRIDRPLRADARLHIGLMDEAGEARQGWFDVSLAETFNPAQTTWQAGDVIHTRWQLELLPDTPPGDYRLELVWPDDLTQSLSLGDVAVE